MDTNVLTIVVVTAAQQHTKCPLRHQVTYRSLPPRAHCHPRSISCFDSRLVWQGFGHVTLWRVAYV